MTKRTPAEIDERAAPPAVAEPWSRLSRAELAVTAVLGGCSAAFASLQLGVVTWSVGLLLALHQARAERRLAQELEPVHRLAELVDLSQRVQVELLRELIDAYISVSEAEFAEPRDELVGAARDELVRLRTEQTSRELATGSYYRWLLPRLDRTREQIKALSLMMGCEWDDSNEEERFIAANVQAAERGVAVDRIFVMDRALLAQARENPAVAEHFSDRGPELLRGHFVDAGHLARTDRRLAAQLGSGFIAFDRRVALVDLHTEDGTARGMVTTRPKTLRELDSVFEQLLVLSKPLTPGLIQRYATSPAAGGVLADQ